MKSLKFLITCLLCASMVACGNTAGEETTTTKADTVTTTVSETTTSIASETPASTTTATATESTTFVDMTVDPLVPDGELKSSEFVVGYDYGLHKKGKAAILFDGCVPFTSTDREDLKPLVAGDILTVYYDGEMTVLASYPGQVNVMWGQIRKVEKTASAEILTCIKDGDGLRSADGYEFIDLPQYVINQDSSFGKLSDLKDGTEVFVAYTAVDSVADKTTVTPAALYSYHPHES